METNDRINKLFQRFVHKTINPEERDELFDFFEQPHNNRLTKQLLAELWDYLHLHAEKGTLNIDETAPDKLDTKGKTLDDHVKDSARKSRAMKSIIKKIKKY